MKEEIEAAANWWSSQLAKKVSSPDIVKAFHRALVEELTTQYTGHWYEKDPQRGSGYRSLSFDQRLDPLLVRAGKKAGLQNLESSLADARCSIMFVNPGLVKVLTEYLKSSPVTILYKKGSLPILPADDGGSLSGGSSPAAGPAGSPVGLAGGVSPSSPSSGSGSGPGSGSQSGSSPGSATAQAAAFSVLGPASPPLGPPPGLLREAKNGPHSLSVLSPPSSPSPLVQSSRSPGGSSSGPSGGPAAIGPIGSGGRIPPGGSGSSVVKGGGISSYSSQNSFRNGFSEPVSSGAIESTRKVGGSVLGLAGESLFPSSGFRSRDKES